MKKFLCLFLFSSFAVLSNAQTFPSFSGKTIAGQSIHIPESTKGKFTLLCFVASKQAVQELEPWLGPVYNKYIAKTGIMDAFFDVNVYLIPIFGNSNKSIEASIQRRFRAEVQEDVWPHVLFPDNDLSTITQKLNMKEEAIPYFLLLDTKGTVVHREQGKFHEDKLDAIDDWIE